MIRDTDHLSTPRPWRWWTTGSEGCSIRAADDRSYRVARLTNAPLETCEADAALIVEAVNAYDRLGAIEAAWPEVMALLGDHGPDEPRTTPRPIAALWKMRAVYDPYRPSDLAATEPEKPKPNDYGSELVARRGRS